MLYRPLHPNLEWNKIDPYFHRSFCHDNVIKWKHFPRYWPFVRGIHRSPVNSPHKGQWRWTLMFSLICAWTNSCANNDLRRHVGHYDVIVMWIEFLCTFITACHHFTKGIGSHDWNLAKVLYSLKFFCVWRSGQIINYTMESWHARNCNLFDFFMLHITQLCIFYKISVMSSYIVCDIGHRPHFHQQDTEGHVWSVQSVLSFPYVGKLCQHVEIFSTLYFLCKMWIMVN